MDLLSKFDAVAVTPDGRITAQDKAICAAHQAAYEAAKSSLKELEYIWEGITAEQWKLLERFHIPPATYLSSSHLSISSSAIRKQVASLHKTFIHNLVSYFNQAYHVSVSCGDVQKILLPAEPERNLLHKEEVQQYNEQLQQLSLCSDQIVDQILVQLDGRSLSEQALYELKEKCHQGAWDTYSGKPRFERGKDTIRFTGYACKYESWLSEDRWDLCDRMKNVLYGLAHYETGSVSSIPGSFTVLLGYNHSSKDLIPFPDCKKVIRLRMYKNGRVDLKFQKEHFAREFVETYLGAVV